MSGADTGLTVATWNMEWKAPGSAAATIMLERLHAAEPDVICFTEAYDTLDLPAGQLITAHADYGYPLTPGRRKVMLWSKYGWEAVDAVGHPELPTGRFVAGRTRTPVGEVTVLGVCIPWRDAHVGSGRRDRAPWEDHMRYLGGLTEVIAATPGPLIVVGDFNQRIPRVYTPVAVHAALLEALSGRLEVATQGLLEPLGRAAIDHIAHSRDFTHGEVRALSNIGPDGEQLSDHFGVVARLCSSQHAPPSLPA